MIGIIKARVFAFKNLTLGNEMQILLLCMMGLARVFCYRCIFIVGHPKKDIILVAY